MSVPSPLQPVHPNEFDFGTRLGILFTVESSAASALAVSGVLSYIAYSAVRIHPNATRRWSTETHVHYYFLNLMICDLILAIGGLLSIKWIAEANVSDPPDTLCITQGVFKHVGDVGVALSTLAIALHILQVSVSKRRFSPKLGLAMIWFVIAALVIVPNAVRRHGIYGPSGKWCWIDTGTRQEIGLDYFWMWLAAATNIVAYVSLAILIKRSDGNLPPTSSRYPRPNGRSYAAAFTTELQHEEHVSAYRMLFYPLVYIIIVLPISASRFSSFVSHHDVPFGVTAFADTLYTSSGLFNTLLYTLTRPSLLRRKPTRDVPSMRTISQRLGRDPFPPDFLDLKRGRSQSVSDFGRPSRI